MHEELEPGTEIGVEPPYRIFHRHGQRYIESHGTVEEALRKQYWGEEGGYISSESVIGEGRQTIFERESDGNIFDFCEERGYDWLPDRIQ